MKLKLGIYKHFKGKKYQVIGLAKHSETLQDMVVYKPLYESEFGDIFWVRPIEEFLETIERDGKLIKRFEFIK